MEGQGTMKMNRNVIIPKLTSGDDGTNNDKKDQKERSGANDDTTTAQAAIAGTEKHDWMIPLQFQSDISHIHQKAGFTQIGL